MTEKLNTSKVCLTIWIFFTVLFFSTSADCLSWADREWISAGCPSKILGVWKARSGNDKDPHKIKISKGIISLTTEEGMKKRFFYREFKFIEQARFLQATLREEDPNSKNILIWKIRPHLTWKSTIVNSNFANKSICLIKVLRFKNQKQARFDQYQSWDIYEKFSD